MTNKAKVIPMTNEVMPRYNIDTSATLVEFSVPVWTARKLDKTTSEEVIHNKNAAARDAARVNKSLLAGRSELDDINKLVTSARGYLYQSTLPWSDSGTRLLPAASYMQFVEEMGKREDEYWAKVDSFINLYPSLITAQAMALGAMFRREDYPDPSTIKHKFGWRLDFFPVPSAGDFRVDVGNDAMRELQKQLNKRTEERLTAAMDELLADFQAHLERMIKQLQVDTLPDGTVQKGKIYDSLIDGGRLLCDRMQALNLINDKKLDDAQHQLASLLRTTQIDDLRKDTDARVELQAKVKELRSRVFGF